MILSALIGLGVGCAVLLGTGAIFWRAHGKAVGDRPDTLLTVLGVLGCGVLYLGSLLILPMLPVPLQDHALGTVAMVFGGLATVIAGGHTAIAAAGGGGIVGIARSLFTSQQPYPCAPSYGMPQLPAVLPMSTSPTQPSSILGRPL